MLFRSTTNITDTNSYYVYVTDSNGCVVSSDTAQVFFTDCNLTPVIALSSSDTVFCEKQCLDFFDLSTNSPTSWQWLFTGASPDTSTLQNPTGICYNNYGSFDVTLIACNSSGCDTLHLTDFITELQNPTDSIYFSADTLYSLPAYSYQWYEASGGLIAGAVNQYFIAQLPGNYYCVVSDSIGCIATSNILTATTLNENGLQLKAYLFPNPGNGSFKILLPEYANCASMKIFNSVGKTVFDKTISGDNFYLETDLSDGIYFMQIIAGSKLYSEKLIIEKP